MKVSKLALVMCILTSVGSFFYGSGTAQATEYYVALNGNDAWSGTLPAPNPGETDGPFATLPHARDVVRNLISQGLTAPVSVVVRGGTYYLSEPVVLGPEDSGESETLSVTWKGYPGEKVVLSGGKVINGGWSLLDDNIYYTDIPEASGGNWKFRQLFVDDRREICARYPNYDPSDILNNGWLHAMDVGFGYILAGLATSGDYAEYEFDVPEAGQYHLWAAYATTYENINTSLTCLIDNGNVALAQMPPSGGWRDVAWTEVATVNVSSSGNHTMRWNNTSSPGRQVYFDAFVLTTNSNFTPQGPPNPLPELAENEKRVVIQAELKTAGSCSAVPFQVYECSGYTPDYDRKYRVYCSRGTIRESWIDAPQAEMNIFAYAGWYNEIVQIAGVDLNDSYISITGSECQGDIRAGNRFFVENVLEELDSPGEWYLDYTTGRLYYRPISGSPGGSTVIAPKIKKIFHLSAAEPDRVQYITISDFTFEHTDYSPDYAEVRTARDGAVILENAQHCAVRDCSFENIGGYGIWLDKDCQYNEIAGNRVTLAGAGGVLLTASSTTYAPINNTISGNHIHHCGHIHKYVSGVHLDSRPSAMINSPGNTVSGNLISHMPRLGIFAYRYQAGNTFEFNHIHHVMLETDDGGGIHINQGGTGYQCPATVIRNNLIHDVMGWRIYSSDLTFRRRYGLGIYLDGSTSCCDIGDNIIYGTSYGGVFINGGNDNNVENNVLGRDVFRQLWVDNYRYPLSMSGNIFNRNIVCGTDTDYWGAVDDYDTGILASDYNLFYHPDPVKEFVVDAVNKTFYEWQSIGYDANSLVGDPLFSDADNDDYSLEFDSPAFGLGFTPIKDIYNREEGACGYWNFNIGEGTWILDCSGNGNDGTVTGGGSYGDGKAGSALEFDGVNDYVDCGNDAGLSITGDLTIAAWVKFDETASGYQWFVCKDFAREYCFGVTSPTGYLRFYHGDGAYEAGNSAGAGLVRGQWIHVAVTRSADPKEVKFYVNGTYVSTWNYTKTPVAGTHAVWLGTRTDLYSYLNGAMDEVRIYSRVLDQDEIYNDYLRGNIRAEWRFDEGNGIAVVKDISGNINHGALQNMETEQCRVDGTTGKALDFALEFDGVNDYVDCGNDAGLSITGDLTIAAWVKFDESASGYQWFVCKDYSREYCFGATSPTGYLRFYHGDGTYEAGNSAGAGLVKGQWMHVAVTRSADPKEVKFYVNGTYVSTWNYSKTPIAGTQAVRLGTRNDLYSYLNGAMDRVHIFDKVLNGNEIYKLWQEGL
ncbi:MAG: right-handed parallel beta-helix repeat-containing protein [bacterium]|nr:right-handed parallel beta-helix repeat-containing protein [bacterium]